MPRWIALRPLAALLVLLAGLAGCAPPAYDPITDQQITAVAQETDGLLVRLITLDERITQLQKLDDPVSQKALADARKAAGYGANIDAYDQISTDLATLKLRMTATPDPSAKPLAKSIDAISDNVTELQRLHATQDHLSRAALQAVRPALQQQFQTLMLYELNLKAGKPG